jgi:hypothetical protein
LSAGSALGRQTCRLSRQKFWLKNWATLWRIFYNKKKHQQYGLRGL